MGEEYCEEDHSSLCVSGGDGYAGLANVSPDGVRSVYMSIASRVVRSQRDPGGGPLVQGLSG
jgi:hypothetical protein